MLMAVTGSCGLLGRSVLAELLAAGHSVRGIDRIEHPAPPSLGYRHIVADLRDVASVSAAIDGCDAIVHLAAWPTPTSASAETIWGDNTLTVGNVLFAAADRGIGRIVVASSQSALGLPWAHDVIVPAYLPVDEDHPCIPSDAYSVSKLAGEELCRALCRGGDVNVRCLRFPVLWEASHHAVHTGRRLNAPEQAAKSLWAYVDLRDAARATRLAMERTLSGFELLNVTSSRAFATEPMAGLVDRWFPGVTDIRVPLGPDTALFDWRRAHEAIGFRSQFVWNPEGIRAEGALA